MRRPSLLVLTGLAALVVAALPGDPAPGPASAAGGGFAGLPGETLSASGGWSWFEGPRALLTDCELLVGSVATNRSEDGSARAGDVDVVSRSLADGTTWVDTLAEELEQDDHDSAALLELPGGRLLSGWTRHNRDQQLRSSVRRPGLAWWSPATTATHPGGTVTYRNLVHLAEEGGPQGTVYDLYRGRSTDGGLRPTVRRSTDLGATWQQVGALLGGVHNRPYVRYADDGSTRLDLGVTEGHPREAVDGTGVYHGYLEGGVLRRSDGAAVSTLGQGVAPDPTSLTPVFVGDPLHLAWILDVAQGPSGPVLVWMVRDRSPGVPEDQRSTYWYGRWDGTAWQSHQVGFAGTPLWVLEELYTGGVAIDPSDTSRLVLSTDVDPASGVSRTNHDLYDAVTADGGATWTFTAITDSPEDDLRPIVAEPTGTARALVWMAGDYDTWEDYDTEVRAVVDGGSEGFCPAPPYVRRAQPFAADLDGDGRTDRVHYRPGGTPDTVFWGDGTRTVVRVDGTYTPILVRFADRPEADTILWWSATGPDYRWDADGHTFTSRAWSGPSGSTPVVGDFDGDGADDLLHYRAGRGSDLLDVSSGAGYQRRTVRVDGSYQPIVGDLTGDGIDDVFWYRPGSGTDPIWTFDAAARPTSTTHQVTGAYVPAVGDQDGNGADDIVWSTSSGPTNVWSFQPGPTPTPVTGRIP